MIDIKKSNLEILTEALSRLENSNLGVDISESSFIYKVYDAFSYGSEELLGAAEALINSNTFDSLTGSSLDNFFSIFGLERMNIVENIYKITLIYTGNFPFTIKEGTIINYDNKDYICTYKTSIESSFSLETFDIYLTEMETVSSLATNFLSIGNLMKIDFDGIIYSGLKSDFVTDVASNCSVSNFELNTLSSETDQAYLSRVQKIFQLFSSDSISKIENILLEVENVNYVYSIEENLSNKFFLIPNSLENLDETFEYAAEIIDYFKNRRIILEKPNYISFEVTGVLSQLSDYSVKENVKLFINSYIENIYLKDNSISKNSFVFELAEYIRNLSDSEFKEFNLDLIEIKYKIYPKCNLNFMLTSSKIYKNEEKTFSFAFYKLDKIS